MKARQEKDARKQQMDIEQMKTQLKNTGDQVGMLLQMLSNIPKTRSKCWHRYYSGSKGFCASKTRYFDQWQNRRRP